MERRTIVVESIIELDTLAEILTVDDVLYILSRWNDRAVQAVYRWLEKMFG